MLFGSFRVTIPDLYFIEEIFKNSCLKCSVFCRIETIIKHVNTINCIVNKEQWTNSNNFLELFIIKLRCVLCFTPAYDADQLSFLMVFKGYYINYLLLKGFTEEFYRGIVMKTGKIRCLFTKS